MCAKTDNEEMFSSMKQQKICIIINLLLINIQGNSHAYYIKTRNHNWFKIHLDQ